MLLTPEQARGGQLDAQEPPLQDAVEAALRERAGRLWHGENRVVDFIQQQLQAWKDTLLAQGLLIRQKSSLYQRSKAGRLSGKGSPVL